MAYTKIREPSMVLSENRLERRRSNLHSDRFHPLRRTKQESVGGGLQSS